MGCLQDGTLNLRWAKRARARFGVPHYDLWLESALVLRDGRTGILG